MVRTKSRCTVGGCINYVVSHGLCDKHRTRLKRHGHLESTRPKDWGERYNHPLYQTWLWRRRSKPRLCKEWENDFQKFADDVGERPGENFKLYVIDKEKDVSKDNVEWREMFLKNSESRRERNKLYARSHRKNNKKIYKNAYIKKKYGITLEQYEKLLEKQGHKCAICGEKEKQVEHKTNKGMTNLAIDHCHKTDKVRGIICMQCNRALGMFKDSSEVIYSAYKYLKNPPNF